MLHNYPSGKNNDENAYFYVPSLILFKKIVIYTKTIIKRITVN